VLTASILISLVSIAYGVLVVGADAMSDAPSMDGISPWPAGAGLVLAAGCLALWFFGVHLP